MSKIREFFEILLDFLEITLIGVTVFILVYLFVGQLLEVTGNSMVPTLVDNEQLVAEKLTKKFKPLERKEIVIFRHPENNRRLFIKRIVGVPGDVIMISEGDVYINGSKLNEPYLLNMSSTTGNKNIEEGSSYKIPENFYVLMGDNRAESSDSRQFGPISSELIVGRAMLVYYPFSNIRIIKD